jgi:hypothetical protein
VSLYLIEDFYVDPQLGPIMEDEIYSFMRWLRAHVLKHYLDHPSESPVINPRTDPFLLRGLFLINPCGTIAQKPCRLNLTTVLAREIILLSAGWRLKVQN